MYLHHFWYFPMIFFSHSEADIGLKNICSEVIGISYNGSNSVWGISACKFPITYKTILPKTSALSISYVHSLLLKKITIDGCLVKKIVYNTFYCCPSHTHVIFFNRSCNIFLRISLLMLFFITLFSSCVMIRLQYNFKYKDFCLVKVSAVEFNYEQFFFLVTNVVQRWKQMMHTLFIFILTISAYMLT